MEKENILKIEDEAMSEISQAKNPQEIETIRVKYLGRQGVLTEILKSIKDLPLEEKKIIGPMANSLRNELEEKIEEQKNKVSKKTSWERIDITQPGEKIRTGHLHPLTIVRQEIEEIFSSMGFSVAEGPEAENDFYNFEALNLPPNHPARDMHDTFWLKAETSDRRPKNKKMLLRTHTSPVQVRYMEKNKPPIRIICPGKVFRYEDIDAGHEIQFHQLEGLMVDKDISFSNFKSVLQSFFEKFFSKNISLRIRPSYFPFVEPGFEMDVTCPRCYKKNKKECPLCSSTGWIEMGGAGMVHPKVFEMSGVDSSDWQGFAFGFGLDRITMVKYNIPDIRLFYSGDLRFIRQFY